MHRFIGLMSLAVLVILSYPAAGEEFHTSWLKFMSGTWDITWKLSDGTPIKATSTAQLAADGNALRREGMQAGGSKTTSLIGWQSDTHTLLDVGFGKNGQYWMTRFRKIEQDRISGQGAGVLPDGRSYKGRFAAVRKGDDQYEMEFKGAVGDEEFTGNGVFIRKGK